MSRDQTFESAFEAIFRELMTGVCTSLPGIITAFDGKNKVSVQPAIQLVVNGEYVTLPVIEDIPILYPGGGGFKITWPISVGDQALLICSQRDISNWKTTGDVSKPYSARRFSSSDAIALVGLESFDGAADVGNTFKISGPNGGSVELTDDPVLSINGGGDSLALTSKVDKIISDLDSVIRNWVPIYETALKAAWLTKYPFPPTTVESESTEVDK